MRELHDTKHGGCLHGQWHPQSSFDRAGEQPAAGGSTKPKLPVGVQVIVILQCAITVCGQSLPREFLLRLRDRAQAAGVEMS
ncbi:hypothetical protein ASD72_07085 [Pseudoxanthomonas sp. Root630]|nr:hypothetical protein ASD72_07085 [Pseudoxanthomonas sp. Root630]